ncbi:putative quinol monooxygenase [Glutamicibacter sp.]|uniref:putative quinol monooxygenase n=1 Tax=Glutamicibacter sp. TaxID=1931995 RepID=UPI003D6A11D6
MYFIVVKFQVKPEFSEEFLQKIENYTNSTKDEEGNLWFEWSRNVDDTNQYILVEAFRDDEAAKTHVNASHFTQGLEIMRPMLENTPRIVSRKVEGDSWDEMQELKI